MKLSILSDLHNEFAEFSPSAPEADVVILAGDIHLGAMGVKWAQKHYTDQKKILYVLGNHEFYNHSFPNIYHVVAEKTKGTNIKLLERRSVVIDNIRFLGCSLWTDFNIVGNRVKNMLSIRRTMNDYYVIDGNKKGKRLLPEDIYAYHQKSLTWLKQQLQQHNQDKIVVVTHHAPSIKSLSTVVNPKEVWPAYASNLEEMIIDHPNIVLWIHGHTHHVWDYQIGNTRVLCNPRGYPGQKSGFKPELIVEL